MACSLPNYIAGHPNPSRLNAAKWAAFWSANCSQGRSFAVAPCTWKAIKMCKKAENFQWEPQTGHCQIQL